MESKCRRIENSLDELASLPDITLIADLDQAKVPVVRKLLTQNSVYFEKLLGPSFREGSQQEVTLQDIDGPTLTAIVNFIYSGNIDLTQDCVANILEGASRMELVSLEKSCKDFLWKNLSKGNCFQIFVLADMHCFDALKTKALKLVGAHFERIPIIDLLRLNGRLFVEILNYDKLDTAEWNLFNLLIYWAEKHGKIGSNHMPRMLKSIRLEHLSGMYILKKAKPIFERYELSDLIYAEYERRMLKHRTRPHRWQGRSVKNIFHAEIVNNERIIIYQCYPKGKQLASIPFPTSRIHQGWVFHDGSFFQMGGYYSAEGGRTSAKVECFDMDTGHHTKLPNMLNARSAFKPIVSGNFIYVFGGQNKQGLMTDCERFDIGSNMWKALPRMPHPLRKIVGIEMNGKIFVSGFVNETAAKYWCIYNTKSKKWMRTRSLGDHDHPTGMKTIVAKRDNHALNITLDSNDILCYEYDTKKHRFESSQGRNIFLPGIEIFKILECAGSPYIFYKSSGKHKFGRIVFNGSEFNIVDSVDTSQKSFDGFLFMHRLGSSRFSSKGI